MDGRAAIGRDWGTLKRTIALLFALAELADRASFAPWPVRVLVLAILRHGETVARLLLVQTSRPAAQPKVAFSGMVAGSSPADALALALRLRLLALALSDLLAPARDTHHGPATGTPAPVNRLLPGTRHALSAIRGPPHADVRHPLPNGSIP